MCALHLRLGVMALFMDSDFSLLKQNQQKDVMDFNALFVEQDHGTGEFAPHLTGWFYH